MNWGMALMEQAKTMEAEEADHLFEQANSKYAAAVQLKPDFHEALNTWGIALIEHAHKKAGGGSR
jgi:hypothetical protein